MLQKSWKNLIELIGIVNLSITLYNAAIYFNLSTPIIISFFFSITEQEMIHGVKRHWTTRRLVWLCPSLSEKPRRKKKILDSLALFPQTMLLFSHYKWIKKEGWGKKLHKTFEFFYKKFGYCSWLPELLN